MTSYILAIDQGTTNSRAILFNINGILIADHELSLAQFYPQPGWVEQSPEEMLNHTLSCCRMAVKKSGIDAAQIAAVGITNQRETSIIWDKQTGQSIYPAIVWQDRRTATLCEKWQRLPIASSIKEKTGLLIDSYFSASKIAWILDHVPNAREKAERGELLFGTVDTYLLWHLTQGKTHATDASNASRTLLFNIHAQKWDAELLTAFNIPETLLPRVLDNTAAFGEMHASILGKAIPICGMAGDQQAATIGQVCFTAGMAKTTYGTGCFMVLNTGQTVKTSAHQLISTILYRINNQVTYALEGSTFCAGTTIKWLRDKLKVIRSSSETSAMAASVKDTEGVYLVPAFSGLGAPYWDANARGALLGMTQNTGIENIVRAALESVAYQTQDLLIAMIKDSGFAIHTMRADGGMAANDWLLQFIANILQMTVERPICIETTALGAAYLAGLQIGWFDSLEDITKHRQAQTHFQPSMPSIQAKKLYAGWQQAVSKVMYSNI